LQLVLLAAILGAPGIEWLRISVVAGCWMACLVNADLESEEADGPAPPGDGPATSIGYQLAIIMIRFQAAVSR